MGGKFVIIFLSIELHIWIMETDAKVDLCVLLTSISFCTLPVN